VELSVVIPSYGLDAMLSTCVSLLDVSIREAGIETFRVVIVDNGSAVPYRHQRFDCRNLDIVRLDRRSSFSRACNAGAHMHPARLLLFLNNDVFLHRLALRDMMELAADPLVGICGARLVYPDDRIQHCGVRLFGGGDGPHHEFHGWPTSSVSRAVRHFQAVTGAALMVKGDAFRATGGFDEIYPFGFEDTDLCLKIRQLGLTVTCSQTVDSIHFESYTNKLPYRHMPSRELFFRRWQGRYAIDGDAAR
jgi:GT2 family glycosyltransferase